MRRSAKKTILQTLVIAGLLGCGSAALAQTAASPDPAPNETATNPTDLNQIIVEGERPYDEETLKQNVRDIAMRGRFGERPLPRFNSRICLHVAEQGSDIAQSVEARIVQNIRTLGLEQGKEGCEVNALVVFVFEPGNFIKGLRKIQPRAFTPRGNQLIREALKRGDAVVPWSSAEFTDSSFGKTDWSNTGQVGGLLTPGGTLVNFGIPGSGFGSVVNPNGPRAVGSTALNLRNSIVVFDAARLEGFTTMQLADHATMHLLGDLQPQVGFSDDSAYSILEMFNVGSENAAPSLTLLDRAYLHGMYSMRPTEYGIRLESSVKKAYGKILNAVCSDMPECDPHNPLANEYSDAGN
jgi:hypothetical protein